MQPYQSPSIGLKVVRSIPRSNRVKKKQKNIESISSWDNRESASNVLFSLSLSVTESCWLSSIFPRIPLEGKNTIQLKLGLKWQNTSRK